jgi:hypothetical protein
MDHGVQCHFETQKKSRGKSKPPSSIRSKTAPTAENSVGAVSTQNEEIFKLPVEKKKNDLGEESFLL